MIDETENDQRVLHLVSDALRAGPGSTEWRRAMEVVQTGPEADELARLKQVRERLQAGKKWRQVRPGTGFTRKVMDAVDQQVDARARSTGPATIIAILCGLLALIVICALVPMFNSRAKPPQAPGDEFKNVYFSTPWIQSDFSHAIGGEWKQTGNLPLVASNGLRWPNSEKKQSGQAGMESVQSLPADQYFSVTAAVQVEGAGAIAQIFVTDQQNELAAAVYPDRVEVILPGGQLQASSDHLAGKTVQVRWIIGPRWAELESDGRRIWTGPNGLSTDLPRSVGVRFIAHDSIGQNTTIKSVTIMKGRQAQ